MVAYCNLSYPSEYGNRISYGRRDLINLNAENLDYLLANGTVAYPIKLQIIDDRTLVAVDERIPKEFLINQRIQDEKFRENSTRQFTVSVGEYNINGYRGKQKLAEGIVYCPYIPKIKELDVNQQTFETL